ncbi:MAG: T9SS type A sorting domain-containing protein [Flavobacterium sp.]|nr:T9SS type A sorting domain-containing protein [Flavobacterium sp.]
MKEFYFLIIGLFFGFGAIAQIVNIPDANFKAKLLAASPDVHVASNTISTGYCIIDTNGDGEIQLSEALLIDYLELPYAGITDFSGLEDFTNVNQIMANGNALTSFSISGLPKLAWIEFSNMPSLTVLDLSGTGVVVLHAENNPNLVSINLKNGKLSHSGGAFSIPGFGTYLQNSPNIEYICVDNDETAYIQSKITALGYNIEVNSYCSTTPGGNFYTITGSQHYDIDNNGCDIFDSGAPFLKYALTGPAGTGILFSDFGGTSYTANVNAGAYTITPLTEHPQYFTITPSTAAVTFPADASPSTIDFCITVNEVHPDLEISFFPITAARPGFDALYKIIFKNNGTQTDTGTVNLNFDDSVFDFVSANPAPTVQAEFNLSWEYSDLKPFESRQIIVMMNLNSPNDNPAVVGGELFYYTASITSPETDETQNDNISTLYQTVVNSIDPNDKTCIEGKNLPPELAGTYVHYVIRFENSGTANAQNIVVKDIIDTSKFNVGSLIPLDGSHPFTTRISDGNRVEFIFENIQLPFDDANNDGYVAFKIKTLPTLTAGTTFSNTASIYFDYNAPVDTNTTTTILQVLGTDDFKFDNYFTLYPNPASDILNITTKQNIQVTSFSIYNTLGQLVLAVPNTTKSIDVSQLTTGNYFIKVFTDKGNTVTRFLKK